jgi:vacuolar protein-sorting-associated protein 4
MFGLNIGTTPCTLIPRDYKLLAQKTSGFSGSDIQVLVRDALMEPIRKVQSSTHFKKVRAKNRNGEEESDHWQPCSPGDKDAVEKDWMDVGTDELLEPELVVADFLRSCVTARPSVNQADLQKYVDWTEEFGQEG